MENIDKVIRDGKVAILVSPGFGAGWSTWAAEELKNFMLFDAGLVTMAERHAPTAEVEEYIKKATGDEYVYLGGWEDVEVEWLPVGTQFYVHEYDGHESTRTASDLVMVA